MMQCDEAVGGVSIEGEKKTGFLHNATYACRSEMLSIFSESLTSAFKNSCSFLK